MAWLLCVGLIVTQTGVISLADTLAAVGIKQRDTLISTATGSSTTDIIDEDIIDEDIIDEDIIDEDIIDEDLIATPPNADLIASPSDANLAGTVQPLKKLQALAITQETGGFVVTMEDGEEYEDGDYTYEEGVLTISTEKHLTISGTNGEPVTGRIVIDEYATCNVMLNELTLDASDGSAITLSGDATLNLTLEGENKLTAAGSAGIYVPQGANLNIGGTDPEAVYTNDGGVLSVAATGAPGIGTTEEGDVGNIAITGVKIIADGVLGIGGYGDTSPGNLIIKGAYVTASHNSKIFVEIIHIENSLVECSYDANNNNASSITDSISSSDRMNYYVRGTYTLPFDWELGEGQKLYIGETTSLIVPAGVTLTNNGEIFVNKNETTQKSGTLTMDGNYTGTGSVTGNGTVNGENADQVPPLDAITCGDWLVSPNTLVSGTHYTYDDLEGTFTLLSSPNEGEEVRIISKIPDAPTEQNLVINIGDTSEDAPVNLTLKNINLTPQQGKIPFELQNGHVILKLEGENVFQAADMTLVQNYPSAGIVIKEGASLEIVGESLSVFGGGIGEKISNPDLGSSNLNTAGGIELWGKLILNAENVSICGGSVKNPDLDWGDSSLGAGGYGISCTGDAALMIHSGTVEVKGGMANGKSEFRVPSGAGICGGTITIQGGSCVTVAGGDASVSPAVNGKRTAGIGLQAVNALKMEGASLTVQYGDPGEAGEIPESAALQSNGVTLSNQSFLYTQGLEIKNRDDMEALQGEDCQIENSIAFVGETGTNTGEVSGMVFGKVRLEKGLCINENEVLRIPAGAVLTVPAGKTLTNNGTIIIEEGGQLVIEPMPGGGETGGEAPGGTTGGTVTNNGTIYNNGTIEGEENVTGNPITHESAISLSIQNSEGTTISRATQGESVTLAVNIRKKKTQTAAFALLRAANPASDTVDFYQGDEANGVLLGTATPYSDGNAAITISLTEENWPVNAVPYKITAVYHGSQELQDNQTTASLLVTAVQTPGEGGNTGGGSDDSDAYENHAATKKEMYTVSLPETEGDWYRRPEGTWGMRTPSGQEIKTSWVVSGRSWYYIDETGTMLTGLRKIGEKYYYFMQDPVNEGKLLVGWTLWNGAWYYGSENNETIGEVHFGWLKIRDKWYFFGTDGVMLMNTRTPDGYYVGADGAWIPGL